MLKIKHSNKFKKDFAQYKKDIESIPNENVKKECYNLLNKLIEEYSYVDAVHDISNKSIEPSRVRENVERGAKIRLELNKFIKDAKR